MFKITQMGIRWTVFFVLLIMFSLIHIGIYKYVKIDDTRIIKNMIENRKIEAKQSTIEKENIWKIQIDKISLNTEITEGTTKENLNKSICHFEETQKMQGNIALAAHNRGYDVNYFADLKLLQKGDEIKYQYNEYKKTYIVDKNIIIKDTDVDVLENTEENMLTLITCVENEPHFRRCVQAIEKEEENN